jgi:hypothetical protein
VRRVKWWLLFGGIGVFGVIFYALLGLWLWRQAKALFVELETATEKLEAVQLDTIAGLPDRDEAHDRRASHGARRVPPAGHRAQVGRGRAGAGQRA